MAALDPAKREACTKARAILQDLNKQGLSAIANYLMAMSSSKAMIMSILTVPFSAWESLETHFKIPVQRRFRTLPSGLQPEAYLGLAYLGI